MFTPHLGAGGTMADHVKRMVDGWYDAAAASAAGDNEVLRPLVDGIYRLIREAETRARERCIGALPDHIDSGTRNQVVDAIRMLEREGKLGRRGPRDNQG